MRNLIVSIHSTANNIVTGPHSDPHNYGSWGQVGVQDALESYLASLSNVDCILMGRITYEDISKSWPKIGERLQAPDVVLRLGEKINMTPKIVVAGKHPHACLAWGAFEAPTQLTGASIEAQIKAIKEADGGDMMTIGSPTLVQSLINAGLVDEYRIYIHPVIVAEGRRLFDKLDRRTDLRLLAFEHFAHGAILVRFSPLLKSK